MPRPRAVRKPAFDRRSLPSVERVLQQLGRHPTLPRPLVVQAVRSAIATARTAQSPPLNSGIASSVRRRLATLERRRLQPVINATGVLIHTNLGRAPMGPAVGEAVHAAATRYSNLEIDLETGERGSRGAHLEDLLARMAHAEAATVVNNCAAALVLTLRHLTAGPRKQVLISRGELVQIGGGFRIPEILEVSGAELREVGTTNRTTLQDYRRAIGPHTALLLKVHRSNFCMSGFVESPATADLAALARRSRVPLVEDLGSGAVVQTEQANGLPHEPTPAEILRHGVDLVCFSGDKLLGGPQCGIIAGRRRLVQALKANPLLRALRCDKLVLTALQTVAETCLDLTGEPDWPDASARVLPLLHMLRIPVEALEARARAIAAALGDTGDTRLEVVRTISQVGGGTLPQSAMPSAGLEIQPADGDAESLARRLRCGRPAVIGYVTRKRLRLDLRAVFADQDLQLTECLRQALSRENGVDAS